MNWKERAVIFLTENAPPPVPPKPTKDPKAPPPVPLVSLGGTEGGPFPVEKKQSTQPEIRHAYQFILRDGESGTYRTESDMEGARDKLINRYGDRLVLVTKAGDKA